MTSSELTARALLGGESKFSCTMTRLRPRVDRYCLSRQAAISADTAHITVLGSWRPLQGALKNVQVKVLC